MRNTALELALSLSLHTRMGATADEVIATAEKFAAFLAADEKPATRRASTKKTDDAAAAEPKASVLEGNVQTPTALTAQAVDGSTGSASSESAAASEPVTETVVDNEPTPEQKDALLAEATKFSQAHGPDALTAALKTVGAERFSLIPFARYADFRAAMAKIDEDKKNAAAANALS